MLTNSLRRATSVRIGERPRFISPDAHVPVESAHWQSVEVNVESFPVAVKGRDTDLNPTENLTFALRGIGAMCGCLRVGHCRLP
jgi:hypothetical protein